MADDEDDLYDEEFDFVDDESEEDDSDAEEAAESPAYEAIDRSEADTTDEVDEPAAEDGVDEYRRPEPPADHVVHIYEYRKFKRTIDRPFTAEDAEAFASDYNKTAKPYARFAIAGKEDVKPKKGLD